MQDQEMSSDSSKYPNSNNDSPLVATSAQSLSGTALNNNQSSTTSSQALLPPSSSSLKTQCSPADKNFVLAAIEPTTTSPQQLRELFPWQRPDQVPLKLHNLIEMFQNIWDGPIPASQNLGWFRLFGTSLFPRHLSVSLVEANP
ncbi:hypothetical protein C9374_010677 [Naegleria lovaniensis]|uniref:Uncharacterized protein n=1 Tax=Naegleria lovaniensis TaxID=51637 RepID=A0AA88KE32_NAELO|nr:uncharacterized protein C9374_010677 [Naegleria lovaniensis]KAG2374658.1 hypothetical protein C9374_010677 [Naegleria lovaniensis]